MVGEFNRFRLTYSIIIINIFIYIISALLSGDLIDMDIETLVHMGALFGPMVVLDEQWWRLFTAMFLHGGMTHLLMNMFSLYIVGRAAQTYFDTKSYISIYLFSGLIGGLVSLYVHPASVGVGASGAIFGIFGALAGFFLAHREKIAAHSKAFMKDFSIIIGINLVIGLSIESVDVSAHIGGLVVGFVGGFFLSKSPKFFVLFNSAMVLLIFMFVARLSSEYAQIQF